MQAQPLLLPYPFLKHPQLITKLWLKNQKKTSAYILISFALYLHSIDLNNKITFL